MQTTSSELTQHKPITVIRLALATAIAAAAAAVANLLIYFLVPTLFDIVLEVPLRGPGSALQPLPAGMVAIASVVPAIVGGLLLGVLNRFTARPILIFRTVALVVLLISLAPLFVLPVAAGVAITLAAMHVLTAALITCMLASHSCGMTICVP
jgi:hypothetical protein